MPSLLPRVQSAAWVICLAGLTGCGNPSGTAVLNFGESNPRGLHNGPLPATLRTSIQDHLGEFGELRIESMAPIKIRHEQDVITHRYRVRVEFIDALNDEQKQAIRDTFDTLLDARNNWPRGLTIGAGQTQIFPGDDLDLLFMRQTGLSSNADEVGSPPTHCTVAADFDPRLPGGDAALASAVRDHEISFEYAPLQKAYNDQRFTFLDESKMPGPFGASDVLKGAWLDFGVTGTAIDMGPMGGMASKGSRDDCQARIVEAGRPFTFDIGWTIDRTREVEIDFPDAG